MWIFLNNAFLSIVDKGGDDGALLVRARRPGDIQAVFPDAQVRTTPSHDYRYRARIPREQVAQTLAEAVRGLNYPNFKGSVKEPGRHVAYMRVWNAMYAYQEMESDTR